MNRTNTSLLIIVICTIFFGSLLLASITTRDDLPIGAMIGLCVLMITGVAGWWVSRRVFKSL